jgi:hypothetical protein
LNFKEYFQNAWNQYNLLLIHFIQIFHKIKLYILYCNVWIMYISICMSKLQFVAVTCNIIETTLTHPAEHFNLLFVSFHYYIIHIQSMQDERYWTTTMSQYWTVFRLNKAVDRINVILVCAPSFCGKNVLYFKILKENVICNSAYDVMKSSKSRIVLHI